MYSVNKIKKIQTDSRQAAEKEREKQKKKTKKKNMMEEKRKGRMRRYADRKQ